MDYAIADLAARPVEQAHASVGVDEAVFNRVSAGANMLPSSQIFTVEKLLPLVGIALANVLIFIGGEGECDQSGKHKNRNNKSFQHWGIS